GRIFIDYLRNGLGATTVCAWSARARPGLGISVPVAWGELPSLRGGDHWSVQTVHQRLNIGDEPRAGYARAAHGFATAMPALGDAPRVASLARHLSLHPPTFGAVPKKEAPLTCCIDSCLFIGFADL
ncbi:MAG TPA: hypothetical protein VFY24_05630, partial [Azospira sp.]|nr:hypothetical protein [Azospira sp.]